MLDERLARDHPEKVRQGLRRRHVGERVEALLDTWLALDAERRALAARRDRVAMNVAAGEVPRTELKSVQRELAHAEDVARACLLELPNLPDPRVPDGESDAANVELRRWGEAPAFAYAPKPHWELASALGLIDVERATRISGPRFPLFVGEGAKLVRALASLMLDLHIPRGYVEVAPPHLVRPDTLEATGHLPHFADDLFAVPRDDLFLSPTSEVQLVGMHAGETLRQDQLPLAYVACAPAFRREAGSAGRGTRGLLRQHQFDKVELVRVTTPEGVDSGFDAILTAAESVLQALELPYRVVALCAGELPFSSQRTCDLEVWMPSQGTYVEISSVSDCGPFQSRRANLRYRPPGPKSRPRYPHTLNGTGLAIGRTLAALLENGQRPDSSVRLPAALANYVDRIELRPPSEPTQPPRHHPGGSLG